MLFMSLWSLMLSATTPYLFTPIVDQQGDNRIRSILQLTDGRMVSVTMSGVETYDGSGFNVWPFPDDEPYRLQGYEGHLHLYLSADEHQLLWIKNYGQLRCFDLETERYINNVDSLFRAHGVNGQIDDFFTAADGGLFVVTQGSIVHPVTEFSYMLPTSEGQLLDIVLSHDRLYLFYESGMMETVDTTGGKKISSSRTYPEEESQRFSSTSLVVTAPTGFYQLRNGSRGGFFRYTPATEKWEKLLETDFILNTLTITDDGTTAYISCPRGIIIMDTATGAITRLPTLRTRSGNILAMEVSTIFSDREGGLWLGTLNRGLLYYHPEAYREFTIDKSLMPAGFVHTEEVPLFSEDNLGNIFLGNRRLTVDAEDGIVVSETDAEAGMRGGEYGTGSAFVASDGSLFFNDADGCHVFVPAADSCRQPQHAPVITEIYIHGERVVPGSETMPVAAPYTDHLTLEHDRNFLTFDCVPLNYITTAPTRIRYMLEGIDTRWNSVIIGGNNTSHPSGRLRAVYTALPPGDYTLRVTTSPEPGSPETTERRMKITIRAPWWDTTPARVIWCLLAIVLVAAIVKSYNLRTRRRLEQKHREEILLTRIRSLIEQCDRYEAEKATSETTVEDCRDHMDSDTEFINRAVALVEQNLNTPGYSVEQLSRDLCMERTGLYRKLTTLLDRSPSLFIRDIRLRHAAALVKEKRMSMAEIAEATGFSSSSYMSRCFQEVYGCRPSEYAEK